MDEADLAQDHMEREAAGLLYRTKQPVGPEANGMCQWCGELVSDERRWCPGTDCHTAWEREQNAGRRNGVLQ